MSAWFVPERRKRGKADEGASSAGRSHRQHQTHPPVLRWAGTLTQKVSWNKRAPCLGEEDIRKTPTRSHLGGLLSRRVTCSEPLATKVPGSC